jgi:hypothetical protein
MFIANEAIFSVPFYLFQTCELSLSLGVIFQIKNFHCARGPGHVKAYCRIIVKNWIYVYSHLLYTRSSSLFHVSGPKMYIYSEDAFNCLWHFKWEAHSQSSSDWIIGIKAHFLTILIISQVSALRLHTSMPFFAWLYQSLFTFLKRLLGENCSLPLWRVHGIKRMYLAPRIHGLFIT